jgi:hypothetical protein
VTLAVIRSEETRPQTPAKQKVSAMRSKLKKDGAVWKVFDSIIGQYDTNIETIYIIGNSVLNEELQKLANFIGFTNYESKRFSVSSNSLLILLFQWINVTSNKKKRVNL